MRSDEEFRQGFTGTPAAQGSEYQKQVPLLAPALKGVRMGGISGWGWRGGLSGLPAPCVALCAGSMSRTLHTEAAVGFWHFCILLLFIICPN